MTQKSVHLNGFMNHASVPLRLCGGHSSPAVDDRSLIQVRDRTSRLCGFLGFPGFSSQPEHRGQPRWRSHNQKLEAPVLAVGNQELAGPRIVGCMPPFVVQVPRDAAIVRAKG